MSIKRLAVLTMAYRENRQRGLSNYLEPTLLEYPGTYRKAYYPRLVIGIEL
jgi:hypothetical protein